MKDFLHHTLFDEIDSHDHWIHHKITEEKIPVFSVMYGKGQQSKKIKKEFALA